MTETNDDRTDEPSADTDGRAREDRPAPKIPGTLNCADRRRLLAALSAAGATSLAGCLFETPERRNRPIETNPGDADNPDDADDEDGADDGSFDVEFLEFGETIEVPDDQELLYAGLDQGWDIPYQCEVGVCGVCTAKVDGDANEYIEHDGNQYLDDDQIEDGWLLTCVGYAREDFSLMTSVHPDEDEDVFDDVDTAGSYDVEFTEFGETIEVPDDQALLYAGLDQGWDIQYACEAGSCGQCTAKVDGDASELVRHDGNQYLEDDQIEEGWLLTCVAYAEDDFALETNVHPDD